MTRYWLTPIINKSPLCFGASRICCEPSLELNKLRDAAHQLHPRLLPMFKSSLLLSDDEEQCGSELVQLELGTPMDIVFDGEPLHLSHCASAFLDRMLDTFEACGLVASLDNSGNQSELHQLWMRSWLNWLEAGWDVILLREDGV
ncbi:hypothetical protein [Paenibacillus sp. SI8]|uniref:hypothetical protein n=1 Tax=unclassified Paenibacillus TaxID=185978 RepID=UPI0034662084